MKIRFEHNTVHENTLDVFPIPVELVCILNEFILWWCFSQLELKPLYLQDMLSYAAICVFVTALSKYLPFNSHNKNYETVKKFVPKSELQQG